MRVLALDLASVCGWAFAEDAAAPVYGAQRMGRRGCDIGEAFEVFGSWLLGRFEEFRPDALAFEAPIRVGLGSAMVERRLMGLAALAEYLARTQTPRIRTYEAEPDTIAVAFMGRARFPGKTKQERRRAKKEATILTCRRYGWDPQDDNAADALALLHYAQSVLGRGTVARSAGPLFA